MASTNGGNVGALIFLTPPEGSGNMCDYTLGVSISLLSVSLGTVNGNLKNGVGVNINFIMASGTLNIYLKNGNEIWVTVNITLKFEDNAITGDYRLVSF
ncbi:hypothetical protein N431DRAFT_461985 [Stipitochalara longipes BDJ]|nr:hypothetical protein N431DRAFT_461985 [Stipitochalara longipes BDJ]